MLLVPTDMPNKLKQTRQTNLTSVGILRNSSNSGSVNKQKKKDRNNFTDNSLYSLLLYISSAYPNNYISSQTNWCLD